MRVVRVVTAACCQTTSKNIPPPLCSTRLEQCLPHQVTWYSGADGNEGIPGIPPCPAIPTAGDIPASLMIVVWCVKLAGSGVAPAVRRAPQGGGALFLCCCAPVGCDFFPLLALPRYQ